MLRIKTRHFQYSTIFDQEKANVAKMLVIVELTEGYIHICYTIQIFCRYKTFQISWKKLHFYFILVSHENTI